MAGDLRVRVGARDHITHAPVRSGSGEADDVLLQYVTELEKRQRRTARLVRLLAATLAALLAVLVVAVAFWGRIGDGLRAMRLDDAEQATVQIVTRDAGGGRISSGAGTVVDPTGLILTNAHVAVPTAPGLNLRYGTEYPASEPPARIEVLVVPEGGDFAELRYRAEPVVADGWLDLAVLRIVADAEGRPLEEELDLTALELGRPGGMNRGDTVHVLGFPGIAGRGAQRITSGEVASWRDEPRLPGSRDVVDTTAAISGGNSGGALVDGEGRLVAVPMSTLRHSRQPVTAGLARPVEHARSLLQAARSGTADGYVSPYVLAPSGSEEATLLGWSEPTPDGECGPPEREARLAGASGVCATFAVDGMAEGLDVSFGVDTAEGPSDDVRYDGEQQVTFLVELADPLYAPLMWRLDVGGGARTLLTGTLRGLGG